MRTIMHVDMNSYFATVEQQANPALRGKPVGIIKALGRGCVIAASVEAKKYGVKTGTTVWEAKKLCPQIVLVPSDMDKYFSITQGFIQIATDYSPSWEVFSIDELFLDVTQTQYLYPGGAFQIALEVKERIRQDLGEWIKCSVGISFTKLLAKLASEMHKPDGLTFLEEPDYLEETANIAVSEVCGIGGARARWLNDRGAHTLGQARKLGGLDPVMADLVWLRVDEPLAETANLAVAKSVSRTFTTFSVLSTQDSVLRLVRNLVEEATAKLREMGMTGRTFCLSLDGFWARKTISIPSDDPKVAFGLLAGEYLRAPVVGVRQAGVWITNLVLSTQCSMLNQREDLLNAVDRINNRFGGFTLYPGSLLGEELIRPEVTGFLGDKWYRFGKYGKT